MYQLFENGTYKTEAQLRREYGLSTMGYNTLKGALPKDWKVFFCETGKSCYFPVPPHNYDVVVNTMDLSKRIYNYISEDITMVHYKYTKWAQELQEDICATIFDFGKVHTDIYAITNVPRLRSFQYRLLQRGLVTNVQLCDWRITPSDECSFCRKEKETLLHLFVRCSEVSTLWEEISQLIKRNYDDQAEISLSARNIVLNAIVAKKRHIANFICLVAKQFIYRQRCLKKSIGVNIFKEHLWNIQRLEKYIAMKNGKLRVYRVKWGIEKGDGETGALQAL